MINKIKRYVKKNKLFCLGLLLTISLLASFGIPTLARLKNRINDTSINYWDGSIAKTFKKGTGTSEDPYIISSGSELAFLSEQLTNTDYTNTYFKMSNSISLNRGLIKYDEENGITYKLDDNTYYVSPYSNKYYSSSDFSNEVGTINMLESLNNFKGNFDGNSFTIYGLYITNSTDEKLGLFTNLNGNVNDLYVDDSLIYGGYITGLISDSTSSNIKNVMYNGYTINNKSALNKRENIKIDDLTVTSDNLESNLNYTLPIINGEIASTTISGNCTINNTNGTDTSFYINGNKISNGFFEVSIGTDLLSSIPYQTITTESGVSISLTNLNYSVNYSSSISAGIVGIADNTTISNVINKSFVYGFNKSSGLVGISTNSNITNSYNKGNVISNNQSNGLVTLIRNSENTTISNCYNTGLTIVEQESGVTNGFVGKVENSTVQINNSFNAYATNYNINQISTSNVTVNNSYYVGDNNYPDSSVELSFTSTTVDNLKDKTFLTGTLLFNEYVDKTTNDSDNTKAWIFENNEYPILYIDDITSPLANIAVSTYSWNNLSFELKNIEFNSSVLFSINQIDTLKHFDSISYYILNSNVPLSKTDLLNVTSWTEYQSSSTIPPAGMPDQGFFIIYAKIVDGSNITYINTDILVIDTDGSDISVTDGNSTWNTLNSSINDNYINTDKQITINAVDELSGIKSVQYYITDTSLTKDQVEGITTWQDYTNPISLTTAGKYIVYAKVVDNAEYVTYANTDCFIITGYNESSFSIGRHTLSDTNYITNRSSINLDISYNEAIEFKNTYQHNLVSSILLPLNSKITLIDKKNNKHYQYIVDTEEDNFNYNQSCDNDTCRTATYPLTLFNEVGKSSKTYFNNADYVGSNIDEHFTILLDLSNTTFTNNYEDVKMYLNIRENDNEIRGTIINTIKPFSIYSNVSDNATNATLSISSDNIQNIDLNSDSLTTINLSTALTYKNMNEKNIIDTTYEDKNLGLQIMMYDNANNLISRDKYKNVRFVVNDNEYLPDSNNITYINLNSGTNVSSIPLVIETSEDNIDLEEGKYKFVVYLYTTYGSLYGNADTASINIPITISNTKKVINYSFDVTMPDDKRILMTSSNLANIPFSILAKGKFKNPNVKVSLYKKNTLTAEDQTYTKTDLLQFSDTVLEASGDLTYYVTKTPLMYNGRDTTLNNIDINLLTYRFDKTGYKFVFDLYDGNKKLGSIEKKIIVK